jgi:hypothetical protein
LAEEGPESEGLTVEGVGGEYRGRSTGSEAIWLKGSRFRRLKGRVCEDIGAVAASYVRH